MSHDLERFDESFVAQYVDLSRPVFTMIGLSDQDLAAATAAMQQGAQLIRLEAARAVLTKTPFSQAVAAEDFPYLRRLHAGLADILDVVPPPELRSLVRRLRELPLDIARFDELSRALAFVAASRESPVEQAAFARFILFEWIRLGMLVATYRDRPKLVAIGLRGRDLDEVVEKRVEELMAAADALHPTEPIRPLRVLFAATLVRFDEAIQAARSEMAGLHAEIREAYEERAVLEAALESLPPLDEVLVRNAAAGALGEQRLHVERLASERPVHFEGKPIDKSNRNRLDARTSRAQRRFAVVAREVKADDVPRARRKHKSLADLLIDGDES